MQIKIKIHQIKKEETDRDDKHLFYLKMSTYKQEIEGRFEKSELRHLIQEIDNAI